MVETRPPERNAGDGSFRIIPYTKQSLLRQQIRAQRGLEHGLHTGCNQDSLPECEPVTVDREKLPPRIFFTPLEDFGQFGLEKTFCVLAKRPAGYYLYRFSAEDSLFLFSPWSPVRRFAIRISCHRYFELSVMTTILINCVFLALTHPIEETEYVFLGIYTVEMMIKMVAKGFILNKYSYLRNPWNWLDFVVVLSGYITIGLQAVGVAIGNLAGLRTFRVLRALKTVSITPGLKTIVNAMLHSLRMLAEVMALTVFCLMVFALLALQLYVGLLRHKCVQNMQVTDVTSNQYSAHVTNKSTWLLDFDGQPAVCGNKTNSRRCPANYTCLPDIGDNPNFGFTNFDSYGWALLTTFQLITLDYWEDVYNKVISATGPSSVFFFLIVVFFGSFYLINLTLAVVAIAYEEEAATTLKEQKKVKSVTTKLPAKLSQTLSAIRAKTRLFPPRSRAEAVARRWCTTRRAISSSTTSPNAIHPTSRPTVGTSNPPSLQQTSNTLSLERDIHIEENEEDVESRIELPESSHYSCIGTAPDIVVSTGGVLPRTRECFTGNADPSSLRFSRLSAANGTERPGVTEQQRINESRSFLNRCCSCFGSWCCRFAYIFRILYKGLVKLRHCLETLVSSRFFELFITLCILLNTAFLSIEHHGMTSEMVRVLRFGNLVFTVIFTSEACAKMVALGQRYFQSRWNVFDLVVVAFSLMDLSFETVGGLSVLRTFRLLRVVKLAQAWPTMRLLLTIIASTLGAVGNMTLVLAVIVYVFAILGVQLFSDVYTEENFAPEPVPRWNFTDFWHSLLMIFRILCGEWVQPLWDCMRVAGEKYHVCVVLFLIVLTVGNFLVLNLFLAMLLNSFNSQQLEEKREKSGNKDSKILRSFRRIKGVLSHPTSNSTWVEPVFRKPSGPTGAFLQQRRWSEPGLSNLLNAKNRIEETAHVTRLCGARGSISVSGRRAASNMRRASCLSNLPPIDDLEKASVLSSDGEEKTPKKNPRRLRKEPPDCCPFFYQIESPTLNENRCCKTWVACRRVFLVIVDHKAFEWTVLALIFASSVVLCFEDVFLNEKPRLLLILRYLNVVFTGCFILEVLMKWMAYGLFKYFKSFWTAMDFVIVCVSVVSVVVESSGTGLYALRAIRTLRALRPLRAISRWQGMKVVVNALMSAIPSIFNVLLVCLVFWLIFSIMGVQFFAGKFYRCLDDSERTLPAEVVSDVQQCLENNYSWVNRDINFDNVGNAYLALFQVATFEGWTEVMEYATDATGVGRQPQEEANFSAYIYFVVFIICGSFFTLNLFIGVIIDNFNMLKKKYEGGIVEMFLTDSQKTYYTAMLKLGKKKPRRIITRPHNTYLRFCYDLAISRKFEILVFLLIFMNMIAMTVERYQQPEHITVILENLNIAFTAIFGVEAFIKIIGLRHHYFTFPWNVFDLCVLVTSAIGIIFEEALNQLVISPTLLRVIRLIRIGRILRLVKAAKGIRKLLFALVISLPALFNIGALLFLVTFVYAIIGMALFGHVKLAKGASSGGVNELTNFQTFANSMLLLFRLTTSAGWNDVLESLMIQPPDCQLNYMNLPNGNCGHPAAAVIYLVSFIIINFMVIINMYIAVILENLSQASKEDTGITEEDIEMFYMCWSQYDPNASQFIHNSQLSDFVASLDPPLGIDKPNTPALIAMNLPIASGERIHCLDILHGLVHLVLGDVEDTQEFRVVQQQIDQRFRKTFPTRNQVEIISTTLKRKQQDYAARVIQRAFKKHKLRPSELKENV